MIISRRSMIVLAAATTTAACSRFKTYNGPEVTRIVVMKSRRQLHLMHNDDILQSYEIDLGFAPEGAKQFEGDGRTPEGRYFIDRRNPNSDFHLSLGISYPNEADIAAARAAGKKPGGDIFIHGKPNGWGPRKGPDWTAGCISVKNREIETIYSMVRLETPIDIFP